MSGFVTNPLYQGQGSGGMNPLYEGPAHKYPDQLIIQFLEGGADDHTITRGSEALNKRGIALGIFSRVVSMTKSGGMFRTFSKAAEGKLTEAMAHMKRSSRIYLRGHGDWESQKIGAWGPHDVADLLARCGLPQVAVISITGCELGRDKGTANDARIGASVNSFASRFHLRLGAKHGIYTVVMARVYCVGIGNPEEEAGKPDLWGKKFTFNDEDDWEGHAKGHDRAHSKVKFTWEDGRQKRTEVS